MAPRIMAAGANPGTPNVNMRCFSCHQMSVFHALGINDASFNRTAIDNSRYMVQLGIRTCSNPECREPAFVEIETGGKILASYPPERLDFDPEGIPRRIVASFEEAITNHANRCFRSTAIMVRRTLEEVCADKQAGGSDLKKRLQALQQVIVVPKELMEAADELRLLGNDAAHLEAQVYDEIGKAEIEAAIDLCKEILKAVYQLASLVQRLRALKGA